MGAPAAGPPPAAEEVAEPEEVAEDVCEVAESRGVEAREAFATETLVTEIPKAEEDKGHGPPHDHGMGGGMGMEGMM
jgi:hypothetical protein